jgi:hypothetical protein
LRGLKVFLKLTLGHKNSAITHYSNTLKHAKKFLTAVWEHLTTKPVHQLNKIICLFLCWRSVSWEFGFQTYSIVSFTIILACMTLSMHSQTTNMTGYLPTSDKSRPRSILGARTRILGIVGTSSAHTQGLQGRQSQATHRCYTHHSNTTCTLPMHQEWNNTLYWDIFWM